MHQYITAESVELVSSGDDYFNVLSDIVSSAKETIHIQTYIIEDDATGKAVKEKLEAAAGRGVKIYLLADAFGSKELSKEFIKQLRSAGIHFRFFSPLFSSEAISLGRRLHHKIVVADKRVVLIGGINIADKYRGTEDEPPWLDFAVLIKGKCCEYLHNLCEGIYKRRKMIEPKVEAIGQNNGPLVRFRRNDWIRKKNEIYTSYKETILKADKKITLLASYFLPGYRFRKRLKRAVERGVKIKIIVTGKTDVPFFHLAEQYMHRQLLKTGAEVYEWTNSVMHGKAMLVDDQWGTIGSYNINYLSRYRSIETNVDIQDAEFSKQASDRFDTIIEKHCTQITKEMVQKKSGVFYGLKTKIAYYFIRGIMSIFLSKKKTHA